MIALLKGGPADGKTLEIPDDNPPKHVNVPTWNGVDWFTDDREPPVRMPAFGQFVYTRTNESWRRGVLIYR